MSEQVKLTEKSAEVFKYVKANGGNVTVDEIANATGREKKSINPNVTDLCKKNLCERVKREVEGEEKPVTYVKLTEAGEAFDI